MTTLVMVPAWAFFLVTVVIWKVLVVPIFDVVTENPVAENMSSDTSQILQKMRLYARTVQYNVRSIWTVWMESDWEGVGHLWKQIQDKMKNRYRISTVRRTTRVKTPGYYSSDELPRVIPLTN